MHERRRRRPDDCLAKFSAERQQGVLGAKTSCVRSFAGEPAAGAGEIAGNCGTEGSDIRCSRLPP